jgi:hypothetical protein
MALGLATTTSSYAGQVDGSATSTAVNCASEPFTTEALPASVLSACGVQQFPLLSTSTLPDGGTAYNYEIYGQAVQYLTPPPSFDPLSASASQLATYGLYKPTTPAALSAWETEHASLHWVAPTPFVVAGSTTAGRSKFAWSGYVGTGHTYTFSLSQWYQPSVTSGCGTSSAAMWTGVGGYGTGTNLAQDGFAAISGGLVGGLTNGQGFYEITGNGAEVGSTVSVSAGQLAEAVTNYEGNNKWQFTLENLAGGGGVQVAYDTANSPVTQSTAEAIFEWPATSPQVNFTYTPNGVGFTNNQVEWNGGNSGGSLGSVPYTGLTQLDTFGYVLSAPTSVPNGTSGAFNVGRTTYCD